MNKITRKHLEYSEGVRYTKFLMFKKASALYMQDRSSENFNRLNRVSADFYKYNLLHMEKVNKFYK